MNEEQELPQGWVTAKLDEIMTPVRGIAFPKEVKAHAPAEGHIACLRTTNVQKNVEWGDLWFIPRQYAKRDDQIIQPLDILISTANSYELVGKVAQVHAIPHQATLGAFISLLRVKAPFDAKFFYHYLSASATQEAIRGFASTTTNISNVSTGKLATLDVVVPPLPEQRRIVAKLEELFSKLDAGVAAVRRTQALLKRYRQSVLHAAVTGELTRAWRETHPTAHAETGAALLQRIRAERRAQWEAAQVAKRGGQLPLGEGWKSKYVEPEAVDTEGLPELPEGWAWATSEQLCSSVASGSTPKPEELFADKGEIPFLKVYNLTKIGHLDFTNKPTFIREQIHNGQLNRSRVNPGDVLINIVGPPLGKVSIVPDQFPEWNINQAIVAFKAVPGYSNKFLLTSLLTETIMNWLLRTAKTTTSQVNLSVTVCRQLPLPLPSEAEQAEIVAEVERRLTVLDALSQTLTDELRRAERLRQSILHQAFTGRLVPQDATDEPAAALLARLRETAIQPKTRKAKETPAAPAKEKKPRGRKPVDATQIDFSFTGE